MKAISCCGRLDTGITKHHDILFLGVSSSFQGSQRSLILLTETDFSVEKTTTVIPQETKVRLGVFCTWYNVSNQKEHIFFLSFCMFPCSKGHLIRAYLDTI